LKYADPEMSERQGGFMAGFDPLRARSAVLFANEAFYRAFADRDYTRMSALWAELLPVLCLHPGWPPLAGRPAVLASWKRLLAGAGLDLAMQSPALHFVGATAFVVCYERVGKDWLVATNAFAQENAEWRLVFHQASPAPAPPPATDDDDAARPN
jgi:hypothetical protein